MSFFMNNRKLWRFLVNVNVHVALKIDDISYWHRERHVFFFYVIKEWDR